MKNIFHSIVTVAFAFTVGNGNALFAQFGGGNGTATNPYEIHNKAHFNLLTDSVNNSKSSPNNWSYGKHFKLMNNITDTVKTVIGSDMGNNRYFEGNFNGNGFKIVLDIIDTQSNNVGLFRVVKNADISNVTVEGYVKGSCRVSGIVGYADGTSTIIQNCINNCNVTGIRISSHNCAQYVSGILGYGINWTIENCINNGKILVNTTYINGHGVGGGIAGSSSDGKIVNCTNTGEISSASILKNDRIGGIIGQFYNTIIENCINSGKVSGDSSVGGICGRNSAYNSKIINCLNIGDIKGNSSIGGISGGSVSSSSPLEIENCVNSGLIIGTDEVGGIVGHLIQGRVSNCINGGVVIGNTNVGGIIGYKTASGTVVSNCHYDKQMCIYGGINNADVTGQAVGYLTNEMTGTQLQSKLGTANFTYSKTKLIQ